MHRIANVTIINFRACSFVDIILNEFTPIVGYNNVGKSTIIESINWFIKPYSLKQNDFNNESDRIQVICTIEGLDTTILESLGAHRQRIEPFVKENKIIVRSLQPFPSCPIKEIKRQILTPDSDPTLDDNWKNPQGFPNAIQALFPEAIYIKAMDDTSEDLGRFKTSSTIGKLLQPLISQINEVHGERLRESLSHIGNLLSADGINRAPELLEIDRGATEKLQDFFPGISVRIDIPTPDLDSIFKGGAVKLKEDGTGIRDIDSMGHGLQRSTQMAIINYIAEKSFSNGNSRTMLLVDEPELYLHPQAIEQVRHALKKLSKGNYQVVFTTHSPNTIDREDMPDTIMVRKDCGSTCIRSTVRKAVYDALKDYESQAITLFELSNSSYLLFCERSILAEGRTEQQLLPFLYENCIGNSLGVDKFALLNINGSGNIMKTRTVLDKLNIPTKTISDFDYAFRCNADFFDENHELYKLSISIFRDFPSSYGFAIDDKGRPKNSQDKRAEEAYHLFTNLNENSVASDIHELFKSNGIWLWPKGSIEYHLGLADKSVSSWSRLKNLVVSQGVDNAIADPHGIRTALYWLKS